MGNQNTRQRVEATLGDLATVHNFNSFQYTDTRLSSEEYTQELRKDSVLPSQLSQDSTTEYSEFESVPCSMSDQNIGRLDSQEENTEGIMGPELRTPADTEAVTFMSDGSVGQNQTQEKKQVQIMAADKASPPRNRRSRFQRQDTPIHPDRINLKPRPPNILKSFSDQNSMSGNSLPVCTVPNRSSSFDTRVQIVEPPAPLGRSPANRFRNTNRLNASHSTTSNSSGASQPSFVCSVDYAESPVQSPSKDIVVEDEFAIFVKASIHPPNELSVPRCYPDPSQNRNLIDQTAANMNKKYKRSKSVSSPYTSRQAISTQRSFGQVSPHNQAISPGFSPHSPSGSRPTSPRPRLRRESAQEIIEDGDVMPDSGVNRQKSIGQSSSRGLSIVQPSRGHQYRPRPPLHSYRSAPGTPSNHQSSGLRMSRSPSRTPSDESYLKVPYVRTRGSSLPESMDPAISNNLYLLRQFNIRGKKVVHLGDKYQQRNRSNSSVNSCYSYQSGHSAYSGMQSGHSSFSRPGSGRSSMDNYSSTDDEQYSYSNTQHSTESQIPTFSVVVLGATGVGKTSLVNKFLSGNFGANSDNFESDNAENRVVIQLEDVECELIFIDQHSSNTTAEELMSLNSGACALIVFSVTEEDSLQEADEILQQLWQSGNLAFNAAIVVGNKTDLVRTRTVPIDKARSVATSNDCKYCEVSAALDHNVDSLLVGIVKQIHLKLQAQLKRNRSNHFVRRKSAGVRMRGIIDKVLGTEPKSKSCDDLYVL